MANFHSLHCRTSPSLLEQVAAYFVYLYQKEWATIPPPLVLVSHFLFPAYIIPEFIGSIMFLSIANSDSTCQFLHLLTFYFVCFELCCCNMSGSRTARRTFEFGRTHVVRPKGKHQATIVWLHGLGDKGSRYLTLFFCQTSRQR